MKPKSNAGSYKAIVAMAVFLAAVHPKAGCAQAAPTAPGGGFFDLPDPVTNAAGALPAPARPLAAAFSPLLVSPLRATNGPLTLPGAVALALELNPEIAQANASLYAAEGMTGEARSQLRPTLGADAGANGYSNGLNAEKGDTLVYSADHLLPTVGAFASLPIDISGYLHAANTQAKFQEIAARLELNTTRNQVVGNVEAAFYNVLRSQALVNVAKENLVDSQARLTDARQKFQNQTVGILDVVRGQTDVALGRQQLITAQNQVAIDLSTLNNAIGLDVNQPLTLSDTGAVESPPGVAPPNVPPVTPETFPGQNGTETPAAAVAPVTPPVVVVLPAPAVPVVPPAAMAAPAPVAPAIAVRVHAAAPIAPHALAPTRPLAPLQARPRAVAARVPAGHAAKPVSTHAAAVKAHAATAPRPHTVAKAATMAHALPHSDMSAAPLAVGGKPLLVARVTAPPVQGAAVPEIPVAMPAAAPEANTAPTANGADAALNADIAAAAAVASRISQTDMDGSTFSVEPAFDQANPGPQFQALLDEALKTRPEVLQGQAEIEAARKGIFLAKRSKLPSMAVGLRYEYAAQTWGTSVELNNLQGFVGVTIPLNDGGLSKARIQQAEGQQAGAEVDQRRAVDSISLDVRQSYANLLNARARVAVANQSLAQAREGYLIAVVRYHAGVTSRAGLSPLLELSDAQAALVQAESSQVGALYDYNVARVHLNFAVGRYSYGDGTPGYAAAPTIR